MSKNQTEPIYYSFNQAVKFCTNYLENEDDLEIDRREVSHIINMIMNICGNKLNIQPFYVNKKENKRMDGDTEGLPPSMLVNPGVIPVEACAISLESNVNASFCSWVAMIRNNTSRG